MTLNIKLASDERLKAVSDVKKITNETLEDAWTRILSGKNSATDQRRLLAVREAMAAGDIEREPSVKPKRFSKAEALRLYAVLAESQKEGKLEALVKHTPSNYRLVLSEQELVDLVDYALANEPIIAIDTETTGLDVYVDVIVGISLTFPNRDMHYYIPIKPTEDERALDSDITLQTIKPLIESKDVKKVLHNASYDKAMFERHGIEMNGLDWDTMTAMKLLNENEMSFQLKHLATKYLDEPSDTFEELFGRNAKFATVPLDVALVYAAKDTELTWRLYQFEIEHLSKMPSVLQYLRDVEIPLIEAVYAMERTGFVIDTEYATTYGAQMAKDLENMEEQLHEILGDININSGQQLKPVIEKIVGEKLDNLDAKKTLKPLSRKFPEIKLLLEYREIKKLYSTYISVLPEKIHPVTGRLHTRFNPNGARTGRFSSGGGGVNLQNQPYAARKLFIAPEGQVIVGADFSAQEIRCAAYFTGEPALVDAFNDGRDPYASLASEYYGKPYEQCYKNPDDSDTIERKRMKTGMLASLYGTGPTTLAMQLGGTVQEAKDFLKTFFERYTHIKSWIDETQTFAKRNGFVWLDKQQRKRRLPAARKRVRPGVYDGEQQSALRQGPNAVIQGTSAIQSKTTLINVHELCKRKGWELLCTIHDEILILMPEDFTREDIAEYEAVILNSYTFGDVPNKTDIEVSKRWGDGISLDEWFKNKEAV